MATAAGDPAVQGLQGRGRRQPSLVPLQPGNERFPDFCLHGAVYSSDDAYCSNQQEPGPGHHQHLENRDDIYHPHHHQKHQHRLSQQQQQQDTPGSPSASPSASSRLSCISTVSVSSSRYSSASFESASSPVSASTSVADGLSSRPQSSCFPSPVAGPVARSRTLTNTSSSSSPSSPTPRSRRDKSQLHAARLQRSGSTSTSISLGLHKAKKPSKSRRFSPSSSTPADALAAVEPPHDQGLTRMAFAEQQQWVKVQQKTFTKWYTMMPIIC